jgi:hypothetical protein
MILALYNKSKSEQIQLAADNIVKLNVSADQN